MVAFLWFWRRSITELVPVPATSGMLPIPQHVAAAPNSQSHVKLTMPAINPGPVKQSKIL